MTSSSLPLEGEELTYQLQFFHPEKISILASMPGMNEEVVAKIYGIDMVWYQNLKNNFQQNAQRAAQELLTNPTFATQVDQLPFAPGTIIVGLGDSITDDCQSWLEILRHLLAQRRPQDKIQVINAGVSGDTTDQMITRFFEITLQQPDWIICFAGTNDARRHGQSPTKVLVSLEETAKNLQMLRHFANSETTAKWMWITPASVIEEQIVKHWFLGQLEVMWLNKDLQAIAELINQQPEPVVNLQPIFGMPANPDLLLPDGLHPSLAGQKAIVKAVVERFVE